MMVGPARDNASMCEPEAAFLQRLFAKMAAHGVRYAVMRNYERLPYGVGGSDLDILVWPEYALLARTLLSEAIADAGGVVIGSVSTPLFFQVVALGSCDGRWWGQCVDLYFGVVHKSATRLACNVELNGVVQLHNNVSVLRRDIAASIGAIKNILVHNEAPQRYLREAVKIGEEEWVDVARVLRPMGKTAIDAYREFLRESSCDHAQKRSLRKLRASLFASAFTVAPASFAVSRLQHEWYRVRRYAKPAGLMIAVLGPDGVGKSTAIRCIESVLTAATHRGLILKHLRPGLLPPLARLRGRKPSTTGTVADPHGSKSSGAAGSCIRATYLLTDYILGYWLSVRPQIAKKPAIVLFDRYAYDLVLDPRRFRIGLPRSVMKRLAQFAPTPDLILCLHAQPEVIAARKKELPLEEIRRQVDELMEFAKNEPRAVLVSTEGTEDEVRERVLTTLRDFFRERAERRKT